jgi:acyl-CoA reductase-like NAD-dependent aldehyde dehydrogenase
VPCATEVAEQLVTDDRIAVLSFTGSEIGWDLKARAGRKTVLLEMGGNAAAIVEPDTDLEYAARRLAMGAFAYAGQVCVSVQRILVHASVYDVFADLLRQQVDREVGYGDPWSSSTIVGPMINTKAYHRVLDWIDEAEELGAKLTAPSGPEAPVIPPVLLENVPEGLPVVDEEVFGPVVCLQKTESFEEALFEVNRSRFGLQAGVFSNDIRKIHQAWEELEVGAVLHDEYPTFRVDHMPYGGVKASGFGREGVRAAIDAYTEPRLLVLRGRH